MGRDDANLTAKHSNAAGKKSSSGKKPVPRKKAVSSKAAVSGKKRTGRKQSASARKTSGGKKPVPGKRTADGKRTVSEKKVSGRKKAAGSAKAGMRSAEMKAGSSVQMSRREEERARRRAERERKVRRQKIVMAVSSCIILLSVIGIAVFCLSSARASFYLFQGSRAIAAEDYVKAQSAYEKAVEIDPDSVRAYCGLADSYRGQQMFTEAEQLLITGWEQTQDETVLRYYGTVVLNQAVAEINAHSCTLATVDKCVRVLEQGGVDEEALKLLGTCYERLFPEAEEEDTCTLFYDEDASQDTCSYIEYEGQLRRMLKVYKERPSEELKTLIQNYAVIDIPYVKISVPHLESYKTLLSEVCEITDEADVVETQACVARAAEIAAYFSTAFDEFEAGNYAYARDLISEESYQKIRDEFIEENSGYWEGSVYIPVNREQLVLHREEGSVRFSFLGPEEYENKQGIIKVLGMKQEDDGVQRSGISYEPPKEAGDDSHTEYTMQYLYSNVKIDGKYVPQMNYRFDTKVTTAEGVTNNAIGDWGGEHEWEIDY